MSIVSLTTALCLSILPVNPVQTFGRAEENNRQQAEYLRAIARAVSQGGHIGFAESFPAMAHKRMAPLDQQGNGDFVHSKTRARIIGEWNASRTTATSGREVALATPLPQLSRRWGRNRIDSYILARMEARNLKPLTEATRYELARRAGWTLLGLPLTLDQLQRFLDDKSSKSYELLVNRLLRSKAHRDFWSLIVASHKKPRDMTKPAQAKSWAFVLWKQVFGGELDPNTHPRLTAYLSTLVQNQNDIRTLRLLVTSATFRQSSEITRELLKTDENNIWWTRFPKTRLPIWVLNRSMVILSGLPNAENKLLSDQQFKPPPQKKPTNTPISTLHLVSSEWLQKAAAGIARRILTSGGRSDKDRFRFAALVVLGRSPTNQEQAEINKVLRKWRKRDVNKEELRLRIAKTGIKVPGNPLEATVWMDISLVLLNTVEFVFKR